MAQEKRRLGDTPEEVERVRAAQEEAASKARAALDNRVPRTTKALLVAGLFAVFLLSFSVGRYPIALPDFLNAIWLALTGNADQLAGAALAVSGASYQGMFKNPLVSPDLLGASAGASLGACVGLLFGLDMFVIQVMAFFGGILAVSFSLWFSKLVKYDPILSLVLAGMLVSTLFQSGMSIVKFSADANDKLPAITFWLMGSFNRIDQADLAMIAAPMLVGFAVLLSQSWKLNVLSFGEEEARSMGINTRRVRLVVIAASTMIVSCTVAVAGIVGWVGLVIPHLARAIVGPNYKKLLPASIVIGAAYLLLVDDLARNLMAIEIPIGILTAVLGVPFFIFIFRHNMKGW